MATLGARKQKAVGSAAWIVAEKENVLQLVNQEMEEIEYPARHEMEWLNEHMAEIFNGNQFNVTEIFKTPGKLRGKTPWTGKKQSARKARVPLSDMFSSDPYVRNSPAPHTSFSRQIAKAVQNVQSKEAVPSQNQNSNPQYNTDSGYHGMPDEDEMEFIYSNTQQEPETATQPLDESTIIPHDPRHALNLSASLDRRTTEGSFHSAREVAQSKETTVEPPEIYSSQSDHAAVRERPESNAERRMKISGHVSGSPGAAQTQSETPKVAEGERQEHDIVLDHPFDDIGSPSDGSTPDRPLIRKSSLNFAPLPAREPMTTKKSMGGAAISRTSHIDQPKPNMTGPNGYVGRLTGGIKSTQTLPEEDSERMSVGDKLGITEEVVLIHEDSDADIKAAKLHNKSSTQLLHERINMLGKSQPSRPTKSIPSVTGMAVAQVSHLDLLSSKQEPVGDGESKVVSQEPGMGDWIKPLRSSTHTQRPQCARQHTAKVMEFPQQDEDTTKSEGQTTKPRLYQDSPDPHSPKSKDLNPSIIFHGKSASTSVLMSPPSSSAAGALQKPVSVSDSVREATPFSPNRYDGPLSASKSRLQSIMKTAKSLFTSSAGVSAAAKLEALSPNGIRSQTSLYPNLSGILEQQASLQSLSSSLERQDGRQTRSSTEREEKRREKELKDRQRMEEQLEKAREQERQKASQFKSTYDQRHLEKLVQVAPTKAPATRTSPRKMAAQNPAVGDVEQNRDEEAKFAVPVLPQHPQNQNDSRRPVRPTRQTRKPKPQPVSIRIGTHSQRIPLTGASLSSSIRDPIVNPSAPPKQPAVSKKASNTSLQTTASTNSFKSSTSSAASKPKTVSAAERRKEQDERESQRKLEVRREAERKRAAQQEEARRQEQMDRAETERRERERERLAADDPKKIAQKQAIEKRRLENARKLEQQRSQQVSSLNDLNSTLHQEKSVLGASSQRGDAGGQRPPSRLNSAQPPNRQANHPPPNSGKPSKRALEEETVSRPVAGNAGVVHQTDAKRRKTNDEPVPDLPARPTMAPPIRQSNVRKEGMKPQIFTHGYSTAPAPSVHNQNRPSLFKNPPAPPRHFQHPAPPQPHRNGHPLEMAKYASGKIPFAEASNPPLLAHKTPASGQQKILKSSPAYPNGENIKLPEIPTDSEDEDSDAERYNMPEWAKEGNLENLLIDQEGKDGENVFGPSAPLHMEEIFRDNKDRMWRFRDRTSSANWGGADGLTQDEIKWDIAERERLKRNGGWTFDT